MFQAVKRRLAAMLACALAITAAVPSAMAYNEPAVSLIRQETVDHAYQLNSLNLFHGTNLGFELERRATRLEGLVMTISMLGKREEALSCTSEHPFWDVPSWGDPYVSYALEHGIANGMGANTFGATTYITADHYMTFLLRALGYDSSRDFRWDQAVEKAADLGIAGADQVNRWLNQTYVRGDMVDMSYQALKARLKDNSITLSQQLAAEQIFTEDAARLAGVWPDGNQPQLPMPLPSDNAQGIPVQSVQVDTEYLMICETETYQLTAAVLPENATCRDVIWRSSDPSVATVKDGLLTAHQVGSTVITAASAADERVYDTIYMDVQEIYYTPVKGLEIQADSLTVPVGKKVEVSAALTPADATDTAVMWSSSDMSIAQVENGMIYGMSEGTAFITARSVSNEQAYDTVTVRVEREGTPQPTPEPVPQPTPEPVPQPTPEPVPQPTPTAPLADGEYTIRLQSNGRLVNAYAGHDKNGTKICTWDRDGSTEQRFRLHHVGGGKYLLYAMCSSNGNNRVLDINRGNSMSNPLRTGLGADLWEANDRPAQEFWLRDFGNGWYAIELAALPGNVLTCNGAGENGTQLTLETCTSAANQLWAFEPVTATQPSRPNLTLGVRPCNLNGSAYHNDNPLYRAGYEGQCTWYAWGRCKEKTGIALNTVNNADTWLDRLNTPGTTAVRDAWKPRTDSIAVYDYCHVRYVEYVEGDAVYYTEANVPMNNVLDANDGILKKLPLSEFAKGCSGYIYLH